MCQTDRSSKNIYFTLYSVELTWILSDFRTLHPRCCNVFMILCVQTLDIWLPSTFKLITSSIGTQLVSNISLPSLSWKLREILVTPLPEDRCTESHAVFHRGVNPRRQETAGEASRCSRTPAHPGKNQRWQLCGLLVNHFICISKQKKWL